jgi:dTDP-4-dehydrorhamnose reductase
MDILITGAQGKLGSQLVTRLQDDHQVHGIDQPDLDITDFEAVHRYVSDQMPALIINAAAWTDVDGCAEDPERAIQVNGYGAQNLAIAAYDIDAAILQVSSNEVFDGRGRSDRAYREYDRPDPINPYAYSKYVGEQAVREINPRHYIVRTAWLFAHGGSNFIHAILNAADAGRDLRVVVDEIGNPTYTNDLADAIAQLIETGRCGIYHLTNSGAASRYAFARYVLDQSGHRDTPIERISRYQWPRPSTPPPYTALTNIAAASLGVRLRPWQQAVDAFLSAENLRG